MSEEIFYTKSLDPFEAQKEIHREQVRRLNAEIIRLKIKCGEAFTEEELITGFGDPPKVIHIGPRG